jgi:pSer/pThr/pTyr-binding forkhead associated (FHA) protein
MTQFVIEVFPTRNSKKVIRHHFKDKAEVTIGSSYACDLIIHDQYVSAKHLKISKNEGLQVEDLNSKNGTRFKKTNIRDQIFSIQSGDKIHIGHTKIQVFSSDHPIQPTKKINWANHLRERLTHPITALLVFCLTCLIYVFNEWLLFT